MITEEIYIEASINGKNIQTNLFSVNTENESVIMLVLCTALMSIIRNQPVNKQNESIQFVIDNLNEAFFSEKFNINE